MRHGARSWQSGHHSGRRADLGGRVNAALGRRQVEGAEVAQYVHDVAGKCKSLIYTKGA
jgi:hypothetical protein